MRGALLLIVFRKCVLNSCVAAFDVAAKFPFATNLYEFRSLALSLV
jgi:hypothetical protein